MPNPEIEEFAKILVQQVRDAAIHRCDLRLSPTAKDPVAKRWREVMQEGDMEKVARVLIPYIVDYALAEFCAAIDEEFLQLSFTASNGKVVNLTRDGLGELCGWYLGSDGWRTSYGKERFVDFCADHK
jgi:hypothetical protein